MAPLHIGYLVQQFPPEVGAGPARVTEMALRWMESGARVTVFTGMPNRPAGVIHPDYRGRWFVEEDWRGIRVLRSWLYASPRHGFARTVANNFSFMATGGVNALVRRARPDVLIASSPPFFPHIAGALVSGLRRMPLVLEVRDLWPDYLVGMGVLPEGSLATRSLFALERALLRRARHTIVVTGSFKERIAAKGVAPEAITVIPNGVDLSFYHPSDEPPPLPSLARRPGEFLVGYLGNFGAGQGLSALLDAAGRLADRPEVRFVVAGDGPERAKLEARAAELGLTNLAMHPPIAKEQTRAFYNACDVCVVPLAGFPILRETVPSKIFEVMGCERPVLAALDGEGATIVRESGGGVVVPAEDGPAIADAVLRLRALPDAERAEMGRRGRAYVRAHYAREVLADRYLEILRRVAAP
jgi:colanic acid biosynthesis glycosyl transferase WcaI